MYSIMSIQLYFFFFFSSRRRHTRCSRDWSSDVCSSDLGRKPGVRYGRKGHRPIPPIVDEEIKVPLPERSPCCGGAMEIGRASWRGRGEISGGAGSFKKKKKKKRESN